MTQIVRAKQNPHLHDITNPLLATSTCHPAPLTDDATLLKVFVHRREDVVVGLLGPSVLC